MFKQFQVGFLIAPIPQRHYVKRVKTYSLSVDTTLIQNMVNQPDSLFECSVTVLVKQIIVNDIVPASQVHQIISNGNEDVDKLVVNCPGNRFDECMGWKNLHISCFVSRAYQMLWDQVLNDIDLMCTNDIEMLRNGVENKFKTRLYTCIHIVNRTRSQKSVCTRYHLHYGRKCLVCHWYDMIERYYKKLIELELIYGSYWDRYQEAVPNLCSHFNIMKKTMVDWEAEKDNEKTLKERKQWRETKENNMK